MIEKSKKIIIVGAGLSGLSTAFKLFQNGDDSFIILEARNRIGGRVYTDNGVDLGATWFQNYHTHLIQLLKKCKLESFDQYASGKSVLVYNSLAPAHVFESDRSAPAARRIVGGSDDLIHKLAEKFQEKILLNSKVLELIDEGEHITVMTQKNSFKAQKVVMTLPPKLSKNIKYSPALPDSLLKVMSETHTWMSNAIKVGLIFNRPFWHENNMSGTIIGQIGPVTELYDHCNSNNEHYALMGFVNEALRDISSQDRKEQVLEYLQKYFGAEIREYVTYLEKDWSLDQFTSSDELKSVYMSPQYGDALFQAFYLNEKLLFSGTETSSVYGGYLEGAVYSGLLAAKKLIDN